MEISEEESTEKSKVRKSSRINTKLLYFKIHYFLTYGASAAVIPFLPIAAKEIGISATALGIGYSTIPIFTFLLNPIIGFFVDFLQNIKIFLIVLLVASSVGFASVLCLPTISYEIVNVTYIRISHFNESEALFNITKPFKRSCLADNLQNYTQCKLSFSDENERILSNETSDFGNIINITNKQIEVMNETKEKINWITFYIKDLFSPKSEEEVPSVSVQCLPPIHQCSFNESHDIFTTFQFWLFFALAVFAFVTNTSGNSLSSVACFELLGTNAKAYGRQRLFGTISWGIVCALSGFLNDHLERSFISVIYLITFFRTADIIILCIIPLPKSHVSSNMRRDLRTIFTSKEIIMFSAGVAIIGFLSAIIYVFEFWFLEEMGASRTLLGLSILMQCLVGEVPFLFFAGWFVNKLGHFLCFTWVFAGFLLRLVFYYFLKDPWLVLPVDTLHGLTYGLFHGAMASFANEKAPKGMEATLLGFFGGLYNGLGYGLGSFLGGLGLDKVGSRQTFLSGSMLSFACFLLFLLASYVFKKSVENKSFQEVAIEIEEIPTNA